jgi:RNA recognition motif-containing protein
MENKYTGQKRSTNNKQDNTPNKKQMNYSVDRSKRKITNSSKKNNYDEDLSTYLNDLNLNTNLNTNTKKHNTKSDSKSKVITIVKENKNEITHTDNTTVKLNNLVKENRRLKVLKQIEFYFSDENLATDKHMKNLILSNTENAVKISEIAQFKRIKFLLKNFSDEDIFKYLQHTVKTFSKFLKLSTNGKSIKRVENFKLNDDVVKELDSKTLYVENLPKHIFHDKFQEIFSEYGVIKLTSLPRHKESNQSKGFGFIVYNTVEEMNSAIKAYEKPFIPNKLKPDKDKSKSVLQPLVVMSKNDWINRKNELKNLCKNNKLNENFTDKLEQGEKSSNLNVNIKDKSEKKAKNGNVGLHSEISNIFIIEITKIRINVNRAKIKNSITTILSKNHSNIKISLINPLKSKSVEIGLEKLNDTIYTSGVNNNFQLKCFVSTNTSINEEDILLLKQKFPNYEIRRIDETEL